MTMTSSDNTAEGCILRQEASCWMELQSQVEKINKSRGCSGKSWLYKNKTICDGQCVKRCGEASAPQHAKYFECCSCLNPEMECTDHSDCGEKLVDTDYVLFVSALASSCSKRAIAFANFCQMDYNRPIAGNLNICPQKLKESTQKLLDAWQRVLVHEIIHALAFSVYLFPYYPGAGKPQWDELGVVIPNVVHRFTRFDWETSKGTVEHHVHMIVTPKVREEARRHFNCSTLEGAELENHGTYETVGSHWEKRAFENELMTGEATTQLLVLSRLSLALLEDSGWYKVNYDNAEDLEWGKNLGCTFATKSCLTWMKLNPSDPYPFCTVYGGDRCSAKRLEKLQCNLVTASKIPFQNITSEYDYNIENLYHDTKGQSVVGFGKVEAADFCPYYESVSLDANVTPICTRPVIAKLEEDPFQIHSLTSRCLDMNISVKVDSEVSKFTWMRSVGCFESICKNNLLMIRTQQSKFYPCYREGQIIHIEKDSHGKNTSELQIVCPSCLELCGPQFCSTEKFEMESIGDEQRTVFKSVKNFKFGTQVMLVSLLMLFVGDW